MQDWTSVLRTVFVSRALDALEETRLLPERKVLYQFCARGHDVTQVLLGPATDRPPRRASLLTIARGRSRLRSA